MSTKSKNKDIEEALYDICECEHSSCNSACPVYAVNDERPGCNKDFDENRGCDCFKDGRSMRIFLEKHERKIRLYYEPKVEVE